MRWLMEMMIANLNMEARTMNGREDAQDYLYGSPKICGWRLTCGTGRTRTGISWRPYSERMTQPDTTRSGRVQDRFVRHVQRKIGQLESTSHVRPHEGLDV